MSTQFWTNEPTILLNKEYIFDLWPTSNMNYEQKLNAITRLIIIITILGYILTSSIRILVAGIVTIIVIFVMYKMRKDKLTSEIMKEGFKIKGNESSGLYEDKTKTITNPETLQSALKSEFKSGNKKNPFSNVLLTDIMDDPDRKAAPPCFNPEVDSDITKNIKKSVQFMNPGIKNTNKQLYGELWENYELDQSNRAFFSTANTRVVNDQGAFSQFLYGNMPSAKGNSPEDNLQREKDNYRYTHY
uniref:Minor capsid protein P9 transmembrane helices domain-containing protein n=1 Tax=viral metagenome TaxID=1070528 RepID=A0A6C0IJF7_9ZZZZ